MLLPKTDPKTPAWMTWVLWLAAVYNLVWGAVVIVAPEFTCRLAGLDPLPRYPELWQCIGMIVGVYGVGYWIASGDPVRHWPIVLVGLLGKIFGPIGLGWSLYQGTLPSKMLGTIVFNDLIWWVPFGLTLWHAATESSRVAEPADREAKPSETLSDQNGSTLAGLSKGQDVLLVLLRHAGCTFCREAIADVARDREALAAKNIVPAFVHMGGDESVAKFAAHGMQDTPRFSDPGRLLYREFELGIGSLGQLFGPATFLRGFKAALVDGHGFGGLEGNGLQMPGAFLVRDGKVVAAYRHEAASSRPDYLQLCEVAT